jgi:isoleucyl-tRNA synthetase
MDRYSSYEACQAINALVDALSNWYVRRSRSRYWATDKQSQDKIDAYWTLYECLVVIAKLIAPFTPFLAEILWKHLKGKLPGVMESVHFCDYPDGSFANTDQTLNKRMSLLREIASMGRSARMDAKLKVRQPLPRVEVTLSDDSHIEWLKVHDDIVREELNVKEIHYASGSSPFVEYSVQPNFRRLGPRVGPLLPKVKQSLSTASGAELLEQMTMHGKIVLTIDGKQIELDNEDIQVRLNAKNGWAAAQGKHCVVALNTELTESLVREGIAKDAIRLIQDMRKKRQCNFTDRIEVNLLSDDTNIRAAIEENHEFICAETLAVRLSMDDIIKSIELEQVELADTTVKLGLRPT